MLQGRLPRLPCPGTPPDSRTSVERGQGVVEYGIILVGSIIVAIAIVVVFHDQVADLVQWIGRTVDAATGAG